MKPLRAAAATLAAGPLPWHHGGVRPVELRAVKRFLRSPRLIVGEIGAIAFAGVLGAALPQAGKASIAELARLREHGPLATALVDLFALDHVFQSAWFLALTLLAAASLSIVVGEQLQRLRVLWSQRLTEAHFQRAPFRVEFERPARLASAPADAAARTVLRTERRLGLVGSPLFHIGILLVIAAGALRALFGVEAVVDLIEGERLPPAAEAWAAQWPAALAKPFQLDVPLTLDAVEATRYPGGDLRDLRVRLSVQRSERVEQEEVAINSELQAPGGRLYLGSDYGPAGLVEWEDDAGALVKEAVLLVRSATGGYEGVSSGPAGARAHLRGHVDGAGNHPSALDVRVLDGSALLFAGTVGIGQRVPLHGGRALALHGVPFWARLRGSRDPGLWLAYTGFALVLAGATIIFAVVKIDTCVVVRPAGNHERVTVALRAQRFPPLFHERFQRLVRQEGGSA